MSKDYKLIMKSVDCGDHYGIAYVRELSTSTQKQVIVDLNTLDGTPTPRIIFEDHSSENVSDSFVQDYRKLDKPDTNKADARCQSILVKPPVTDSGNYFLMALTVGGNLDKDDDAAQFGFDLGVLTDVGSGFEVGGSVGIRLFMANDRDMDGGIVSVSPTGAARLRWNWSELTGNQTVRQYKLLSPVVWAGGNIKIGPSKLFEGGLIFGGGIELLHIGIVAIAMEGSVATNQPVMTNFVGTFYF